MYCNKNKKGSSGQYQSIASRAIYSQQRETIKKSIMNQNEFMQLVLPFKDKVFRVAKRLLVSTEEAEDATQEVLVKLWTKNESLSAYNSVEALAMTMTKNYCLDQ